MKVVLLKDVKGVGRVGEVRETSDGYARNFLLRNKLAAPADQSTIDRLAKSAEEQKKRSENRQKTAENVAKKLRNLVFEITAHGENGGKLYSSLKESEILATIRRVAPFFPQSAKITDYHPLKAAGRYDVSIDLGEGVKAEISITIKTDGSKKTEK